RRTESRAIRARQVRRPLRIRADRSHRQKTQRRALAGEGRAEIRRQRHQSDGRLEAQPGEREAVRPRGESQRQKAAQGRGGSARDAAADQRQARQGRTKSAADEEGGEAGPPRSPIEKGRIGAQALAAARVDSAPMPTGFATANAWPEMPWSAPFDQPIRLRGGRKLATLQHAADYIMKL